MKGSLLLYNFEIKLFDFFLPV